MKVLSFITSLSLEAGGPSRSVPQLARGLAELGVDITIMTYHTNDMNIHALDGSNIVLKVLDGSVSIRQMEKFILNERFDIIQLQSIWDLKYHWIAHIARKYDIPYIITPRGMLEPWSLSQKRLKKKLAMSIYQMRDLKDAACIFTTAESEAHHIQDLGVSVPISVIPNGIDTSGYPCRTSYDAVKKQILFLSRIHVKKGLEILIDAYALLKDSFPQWRLLIVGNGDTLYIDGLKNKVAQLGLAEAIEILPPVFGEDKVKLYQESALFCLPSYSENFGMVIAEAMSCGVPSITTNATPWQLLNGEETTMGATFDDLGKEKKTGWCIDLNVENLANTLREAMSMDFKSLFDMGQRASKLIDSNFNYLAVAEKTKSLYEWILTRGSKPSFIKNI